MVSVFGNHFGIRYLESDYGYLVSDACTLCAHALRALHIFSPPSTPQGTLASLLDWFSCLRYCRFESVPLFYLLCEKEQYFYLAYDTER